MPSTLTYPGEERSTCITMQKIEHNLLTTKKFVVHILQGSRHIEYRTVCCKMSATENVLNSCKMDWQKFCIFSHWHCEIGSKCFGNRLMKSFIWCLLIRHLPMMSCLIIVHYRASGSSLKLARPARYVNSRQPNGGRGHAAPHITVSNLLCTWHGVHTRV